MATVIGIARAATPTSTGTQDLTTTDLGGLTPKAAYFIMGGNNGDGVQDYARMCLGAATATNERWACMMIDSHGANPSNNWRSMYSTVCVHWLNTSGVQAAAADFDSFITNGVRIDWTDAPTGVFSITAILFAGDEVSAHAGTFDIPDAEDGTVDVTDPGFEPDLLFGITSVVGDLNGKYATGVAHLGHAVNGGGQCAFGMTAVDDNSPTIVAGEMNDGYGFTAIAYNRIWFHLEFGGWDSNGFTATKRTEADGDTESICYLALAFSDNPSISVEVIDTPTTTGTESYTGPGFQPMFLCLGLSALEYVDTWNSTHYGGSFGIGLATSVAKQYTAAMQCDSVVTTSNTQSLRDSIIGNQPAEHGAVQNEADLDSFDPTGFTLDFTSAGGTVRKWIALAIEDLAAGQAIAAMDHHYRSRRV